MPKKRTSADRSNDHEPTNGDSESLRQEDCDGKRQKLDSISDTMLQDLPIELLESILVRVVAMEVKRWKLAKNGWEDKADLVIRRLGTVCSEWSNILTTKFFWNELQRTLDDTVQGPIYLEIVHKTPTQSTVTAMTTLKDDVFMLSQAAGQRTLFPWLGFSVQPEWHYWQHGTDFVIEIYDRNNMEEVKQIIPLPGADLVIMRACSVSNCVYAFMRLKNCVSISVLRISKDAEQKFSVSSWVFDRTHLLSIPSISPNGTLLILTNSWRQTPVVTRVDVYDGNGSLQHTVTVPPADVLVHLNLIQKSNGNLVQCYVDRQNQKLNLMEFDMNGTAVRHYQSTAEGDYCVTCGDRYGRFMITELHRNIELLDSEFNPVGAFISPHRGKNFVHSDFHYDSERNEIVRVFYDKNTNTRFLSTLRITEE